VKPLRGRGTRLSRGLRRITGTTRESLFLSFPTALIFSNQKELWRNPVPAALTGGKKKSLEKAPEQGDIYQ
jgi:hypothetical protein